MDDKGKAIQLMEDLQHLTSLEGWKAIEAEINRKHTDSLNRLRKCPLDEVIKYRERADAYEHILKFITDSIEAGKEAMREVE